MNDILDYIKSVLYAKSIKNIVGVHINNTMFLVVKFNNYTVLHKMNQELRSFLCIAQQFNIKKISKEKKYCISQPVGFYDLFGITEGDTIEFSSVDPDDDFLMNIVFQCSVE